MYKTKSKKELELMKIAGDMAAYAKIKIKEAVKPGITTKEIDKIAREAIESKGGKPAFLGYQGFPGTVCASVNDELIHGIPSDRALEEGDILKIDMGAIHKGYYSDTAFSIAVGKASKKDEKLMQVAKDAFFAGMNEFKIGNRIGDVSAAIGAHIKRMGMYTPKQFSGHGIGSHLHEEPYVYNFGTKGTGPIIKEGMVICIEPMIVQNSDSVRILEDGWTVVSADGTNTAHYEQTIAMIDGVATILTEDI